MSDFPHHPLLNQKCAISRSAVAFVHPMQEPERHPCPKPPEIEPKKDKRLLKWMLATSAFMAATVGFAVYAKENCEVRDWLSIQAPWFDEFIAILYEENDSYAETIIKSICGAYDFGYNHVMTYKKCNFPENPPVEELPYSYCTEKDEQERLAKECCDGSKKELECEEMVLEDKPCPDLPPPVLLKDICEMEKCLLDHLHAIMANYYTATKSNALYVETYEKLLRNFCPENVGKLCECKEERDNLCKEALENIEQSQKAINSLTAYLNSCGDFQVPKPEFENTKNMLKDIENKVKAYDLEYKLENERSTAWEQAWKFVRERNDYYIALNEQIFSNLNYNSKKPKLEGDPDLLLIFALKNIRELEKERLEAANTMKERNDRAHASLLEKEKEKEEAERIKAAKKDPQKKTIPPPKEDPKKEKEELDKAVAKRTESIKADIISRTEELQNTFEKRNSETIDNLKTHFEKTKEAKLKQREEEVLARIERNIEEMVQAERETNQKQVEEIEAKLAAIEADLAARLKAEEEVKRCQQMYNAASDLLRAMKKGGKRVDVSQELRMLEQAGQEDSLVSQVLKSIPDEVRNKGVVPESTLLKKYISMESVALKVALVEQEGSRMPVYWLSYLQYLLLWFRPSDIPSEEMTKPPEKIPPNLDTFDLLQRARYWASKREFATALRYVDALEGASKSAAHSWLTTAREHIDTRVAAEAVLAHASAQSQRYV